MDKDRVTWTKAKLVITAKDIKHTTSGSSKGEIHYAIMGPKNHSNATSRLGEKIRV